MYRSIDLDELKWLLAKPSTRNVRLLLNPWPNAPSLDVQRGSLTWRARDRKVSSENRKHFSFVLQFRLLETKLDATKKDRPESGKEKREETEVRGVRTKLR